MSDDLFIGRTREGQRVYVSARLTKADRGSYTTVNHEQRHGAYTELGLQGVIIRKGGSITRDGDWESTGQIDPTVIVRPEEGWTRAELRTLADIWQRWHLNGMRAGCAHQPPASVVYEDSQYGRRVDLDNTPRCPETGYKYGSAWLVEELPADVIEFIGRKFGIEVS